ncbi:unnamed protein product [Ostreobium quekettii]|uniref:Uncharacterized protein n=1 Tax=Ostreobium quekettii TaxID=121088 RepID=A0A8S1J0T3_9CHLO|nr:unnamed protein product [Ostreobium quekettii]
MAELPLQLQYNCVRQPLDSNMECCSLLLCTLVSQTRRLARCLSRHSKGAQGRLPARTRFMHGGTSWPWMRGHGAWYMSVVAVAASMNAELPDLNCRQTVDGLSLMAIQ